MELVIIILGIIIDRITKIWAFNNLRLGDDIELIKNFFHLQYLENRGAAFGIMQGKTVFLAIITIIILGGIVYFMFKEMKKTLISRISLSLIISGAIGNLFDRIYYKYVVDFIMVHYKNIYYFPTFNFADIFVVIGTILLCYSIIKEWD
ncbi:signal peptidase II [Clostridium sp. DL1XJH146]